VTENDKRDVPGRKLDFYTLTGITVAPTDACKMVMGACAPALQVGWDGDIFLTWHAASLIAAELDASQRRFSKLICAHHDSNIHFRRGVQHMLAWSCTLPRIRNISIPTPHCQHDSPATIKDESKRRLAQALTHVRVNLETPGTCCHLARSKLRKTISLRTSPLSHVVL
jgi:hypothetical protein